MLHTHSQRLERWLGVEQVERVSRSMLNWYGPPIAVQGVPGAVFAAKGGDFIGAIDAGYEISSRERLENSIRRELKKKRLAQSIMRHRYQLGMAGFASFSDLIAEASTGKLREFHFNKAGPTGVVNVSSSLWGLGATPAAGANASNAPGGDALTQATTGAFPNLDNVSTDTRHFVWGGALSSVAQNTLLLYDRIFQVNKTMNSTANEAVTGVPTRYQSSTPSAADYAGGNFIFVEVGTTVLAGTTHNWGVAGGSNECLYRNQAGTDNSIMPVLTGRSAAAVRTFDHAVANQQWFAPLATGDTGAMDLAQMRCSALVGTGVINFVIGHPIAFMACPLANIICEVDGINTAFNLVRVFDGAALALIEVIRNATTATNYSGSFRLAHG
jgi:hypothetical protein